ncbi:MAG TPA: hypothetical protein VIV06_12555 [Candidatus Limnocylindrales bacterium]
MRLRSENSVDERWQVSPRNTDGTRRRTGTWIGRVQVTPTRVTLAVALFGSLVFVLYSLTVRDASQIPMLAAGSGVLGLVFGALAVAGAVSTYRAGMIGEGGRAFAMALLGGLASLIAAGCFAAAAILSLLVRPV